MKYALALTTSVYLFSSFICHGAEQRILLPSTTINGQKATLALDTGSNASFIFQDTAQELGLHITPLPGPAKNSDVLVGTTHADIGMFDTTVSFPLGVITLPFEATSKVDGFISWYVFRKGILILDAKNSIAKRIRTLPGYIASWDSFQLASDTKQLVFKAPKTQSSEAFTVLIDTGWDGGVGVHPDLWKSYKARVADHPGSLTANWTASTGTRITSEFWADSLSLGTTEISQVPIQEYDTPYDFTLGLYGLRRLRCVVDWSNETIYIKPKSSQSSTSDYEHNRLGALFPPKNPQSDTYERSAQVVAGTPAYEAGIRDNDTLLEVDGVDVNRRIADPKKRPGVNWTRPPSTKLRLKLRRGEETYTTEVELRNLLPPQASSESNAR